jgi:hypothetical protein
MIERYGKWVEPLRVPEPTHSCAVAPLLTSNLCCHDQVWSSVGQADASTDVVPVIPTATIQLDIRTWVLASHITHQSGSAYRVWSVKVRGAFPRIIGAAYHGQK